MRSFLDANKIRRSNPDTADLLFTNFLPMKSSNFFFFSFEISISYCIPIYFGLNPNNYNFNYVDEINLEHGAPKDITDPTTPEVYEIERKGISVGLKLLKSRVRHLGTEINLKVLTSINEKLKEHIDCSFKTAVDTLIIENNEVKGIIFEP